jgi:hypothetical protein
MEQNDAIPKPPANAVESSKQSEGHDNIPTGAQTQATSVSASVPVPPSNSEDSFWLGFLFGFLLFMGNAIILAGLVGYIVLVINYKKKGLKKSAAGLSVAYLTFTIILFIFIALWALVLAAAGGLIK